LSLPSVGVPEVPVVVTLTNSEAQPSVGVLEVPVVVTLTNSDEWLSVGVLEVPVDTLVDIGVDCTPKPQKNKCVANIETLNFENFQGFI
jgi:hypothetical protein